MTQQELLNKLETYRINHDQDIPTFTKQIGLSPATYYNWKKGASPKAIEVIISILELLPTIKEE